ncbi:MAG: DEAD/DEAH box helicase, partial [Planctomycetota bacterium]
MNTVAVNSKRLKLSKQLASELVDCSASELKALANRQRHFACEHIATSYETLDDQWQSLSTALVIEATRRTLGFSLFDTQIEAGLIFAGNRVCEMQTGEGKTLAMAIPAASRALEGRGVHVAVPNEYLAKRDYDFLRPMFAAVDLTSGVLQTGMDEASTRNAYAQDITYGPGYRFAFDYLRDELAVERSRVERATQGRRFQFTPGCDSPRRLQRGLHAAIIDEIDHVLLDDAMSPLVISHGVQGDALDADWIRAANQCAEHLVVNQDYQIDAKNRIRLAHRGISQVYTLQPATIECELVRPWHEYVTLALRAQHTLHRDRNYTILDERICIIDQSTGRLHQDRTWSGG